jgi:hypothetical protein
MDAEKRAIYDASIDHWSTGAASGSDYWEKYHRVRVDPQAWLKTNGTTTQLALSDTSAGSSRPWILEYQKAFRLGAEAMARGTAHKNGVPVLGTPPVLSIAPLRAADGAALAAFHRALVLADEAAFQAPGHCLTAQHRAVSTSGSESGGSPLQGHVHMVPIPLLNRAPWSPELLDPARAPAGASYPPSRKAIDEAVRAAPNDAHAESDM